MVLPVVIGRREERRGKVSRCFFCFLLFAFCYLLLPLLFDRNDINRQSV
jgi:hypothetical protein